MMVWSGLLFVCVVMGIVIGWTITKLCLGWFNTTESWARLSCGRGILTGGLLTTARRALGKLPGLHPDFSFCRV
jgi:hypothetical protein